MIPSSKKQRQIIAIGCEKLGIDADTRHAILMERYGVASSTLLTNDQASDFIASLRGKGFGIGGLATRPPYKPRRAYAATKPARATGKNVVRIASKEQHYKIASLSNLIHWRVKDGFTRWLEKRFTIQRVKTASEAWQVIEGLKAMFENQMRAEYGQDWWLNDFEDPDIHRFIVEHVEHARNRQGGGKR